VKITLPAPRQTKIANPTQIGRSEYQGQHAKTLAKIIMRLNFV
jgi:hypothetical protein